MLGSCFRGMPGVIDLPCEKSEDSTAWLRLAATCAGSVKWCFIFFRCDLYIHNSPYPLKYKIPETIFTITSCLQLTLPSFFQSLVTEPKLGATSVFLDHLSPSDFLWITDSTEFWLQIGQRLRGDFFWGREKGQ